MIPDIEYLRGKFAEFNRVMFEGKLPEVPILLADSGRFLGKCESTVKKCPGGRRVYSDFRLRFNIRVDLPEMVVEDVIVHEMIHYYILYFGIQDTSAHGKVFRKMMEDINRRFGRSISITHRPTPEQREALVDSRKRWHIIAVLKLIDRRHNRRLTGVKVLPRVLPTINKYYERMNGGRDVESIELYLHNNPFFNRFPSSGGFFVNEISPELLEQNLSGARKIRLENGILREIREN